MYISLQHTSVDPLYLTNLISADAALMDGTNNFLSFNFDSFMSMVIGFEDYHRVNDIPNSNTPAPKNTIMMTYDLCKSDTNLYDNNSKTLNMLGNVEYVAENVQGLKQAQYKYKLYDDNG